MMTLVMEIESLMMIYEIMSGIGGVVQIVLIIMRRTNNPILALALILDAIGLSGMSFGYFLAGESIFAILSIAGLIADICFIVYIVYREEHPKKPKQKKKTDKSDSNPAT